MGESGLQGVGLQAEEQKQVINVDVDYDGGWIIVFIFPSNPYYLWHVAGVVPCRNHTVRLYLGGSFIKVQC